MKLKTFIYPLSAFLTPLPIIPFTIEEITGSTIEATEDDSKAPINLPSCVFLSRFTVSLNVMTLWF